MLLMPMQVGLDVLADRQDLDGVVFGLYVVDGRTFVWFTRRHRRKHLLGI